MLSRFVTGSAFIGFITACHADSPLTPSEDKTLESEVISIARTGGPSCPGDRGYSEENARCAYVDLNYPVFKGNNTAARKLNEFVVRTMSASDNPDGEVPATPEAFADSFINEYTRFADDGGPAWETSRNLSVVYHDHGLLTLDLSGHVYTGGAHPNSWQHYYMFNAATGQRLQLGDLLHSGYEEKLNPMAETAFRAYHQLSENTSLQDAGFSFNHDRFSVNDNAGVTEKGVAFVFNPYEIAPYALGASEFVVPWTQLAPLIDESGLIEEMR